MQLPLKKIQSAASAKINHFIFCHKNCYILLGKNYIFTLSLHYTLSLGFYISHILFSRTHGHFFAQKVLSKHRLYWFAFSAMISGVITMVVLICYCCHKNVRKHRPQEYSHYWRTEPDVHSLEVFTMDTHAMVSECFLSKENCFSYIMNTLENKCPLNHFFF